MKSFTKILLLTLLLAITIDTVRSCDCQGFSTLINEFKTIRAECTHLCKFLSSQPEKFKEKDIYHYFQQILSFVLNQKK